MRSIDTIQLGDSASFTKTVTECDVVSFAGISGDFNPAHMDKASAEKGMFGQRIAHGMLSAGFISTVLGTQLPGPGTIYLSQELKFVKQVVVETADAEIAAAGAKLEYEVGTMIEIPRAALTADEIAANADFFCFGTNDLTQMTFGFSRDDAGKFLNAYYDEKIFENDPFAKLDQTGVGKLMEMSLKLGKPVNPKLHVGICGEHGGDPSSVEFCHKIGLDYVSCSPFRVPIARLAAAQAAINNK